MRSKYIQSRIGETYNQVREFLQNGRKVLYTATPCQIAGLKSFLGKEYDNLICVDLVCHGIPSIKVWREYLKWTSRGDDVLDVNFREKKDGWLNWQCVTTTTTTTTTCEKWMNNLYFRGFLKNIYLSRSCYHCSHKLVHRSSDLTLADAWGVQNFCPEMHDDKGTSLILAHTAKGEAILHALEGMRTITRVAINDALKENPYMIVSANMPRNRKLFFLALNIGGFGLAKRYIDKDVLIIRILRKIKKMFNWMKILPFTNTYGIKNGIKAK